QARQAFEANQFAYETGKATFLEWITAQRNLRDLEAMEQQHNADYYAALAELEAVVGADLNLFPSTTTKENKMKSLTLKLFVLAALLMSPACPKSTKSTKPPDDDYYTS